MIRIAISTDGDQVSPHFGRCATYTIIDLEDGKVKAQEVIENPGHEPGFLPQYLQKGGVNAIVAGGMGPRAQNLFQEVGIDVYLGAEGPIDEVIKQLQKGTLIAGESSCTHEQDSGNGNCDHSQGSGLDS